MLQVIRVNQAVVLVVTCVLKFMDILENLLRQCLIVAVNFRDGRVGADKQSASTFMDELNNMIPLKDHLPLRKFSCYNEDFLSDINWNPK